jgi:hypothetical protein
MLTKVSAGVLNIDDLYGFRNRIINGDMRIAQRGTAALTASGDNQYPVDRFGSQKIGISSGAYTIQQSSTTPTGFKNSVVVTVTSSGSVSGTDRATFFQFIEGNNVADFDWGTANAKTVTLSFWVRSSLTGTFGGAVNNADVNRSYPFTYSISTADTWEYKTVTIAGDTTGTWGTTTGVGIRIYFGIGVGPDRSGTAGTWAGADYRSATGATNIIGTNGATWYITGVQLEVGSVATPFERRPYGTELALCQRYYYRLTIDNGSVFGAGYNQNTTATRNIIPFPVTMRTKPTAVETTGTAGNYRVLHGTTVTACSAIPTFNSASVNNGEVQATVSSGLTAGQGNMLETNANGTYLGWSAEL